MKKIVFSILSLAFPIIAVGQAFNIEKVAWINYVVRMYENAPFEGIRIVNDYDNSYLISVLALDKSKYTSEAALNRVAAVKAMSQASRYFNGSNITSEMIIHTNEKNDGSTDTEIIENIQENSIGYVKSLEQLTNFQREDGLQVFIFSTTINQN